MQEKLVFHIIYTPGTVRYLTPLVGSLLHWSDCDFRLVANGCATDEAAELACFCADNPRLAFVPLPWPQLVAHGEALNYLFANSSERRFAFMDSDVMATGPFTDTFADVPARLACVSSGTPVNIPHAETIWSGQKGLYGTQNHLESGNVVGGTYIAVYDRQAVEAVMALEKGVDFLIRAWRSLDDTQQSSLQDFGVVTQWFDTAKVLNILMQHHGYQLGWRDSEQLHHLGGFSRVVSGMPEDEHVKQLKANSLLRRLRLMRGTLLRWVLAHLPKAWKHALLGVYYRKDVPREMSAIQYFSVLIQNAVDDRPCPTWQPVVHPEVRARVASVADNVRALYCGNDAPHNAD